MAKKVGKITREKGMMYYVDGSGNVMGTQMKRRKKAAKKTATKTAKKKAVKRRKK